MKKLLIFSVIAVILVAGLGLYATKVMGDFHRRDQELEKTHAERVADLEALDELFPYTWPGKLDPVRFPTWLEVRKILSDEFESRIHEQARSAFHARETRNAMLRIARLALQEKKMSLHEYRATAARWRELLARPEFAELQAAWKATVNNRSHPDGLPLPPPAADATEKERELIRRYARPLEDSMYADLFGP